MSKGKILLVDNLAHVRESVGNLLTLTGYLVYTAASPEEAKEVLRKKPVHLALIDLRLLDHSNERDTSGITLAGELDPLIPCIITAYESLLEQGDLATALLEARCEIAGQRGRNDETWLSPILIAQE